LVTCSGSASGFDQNGFADIKLTPEAKTLVGGLRQDAYEIASLLEIEPYVAKLRAEQPPSGSTAVPRPILNAKMICLWKLMAASQEVRRIVAAINHDLSKAYIALDVLTTKRDRTQNLLNTGNFMQGGILGITRQNNSLQGHFRAGGVTLVTSSSISTGLSVINLLLPSAWSQKVAPPANTLVRFLDLQYTPPDAAQSFLWKFLNSEVPGSSIKMTRRQVLIKHWEAFEGLDAKDEKRLRRLASAPEASENLDEDIRIISQRIELLHDLKTHVEEFDASLYELHKAISSK